jgi:hypothetical protein
VRGADEVGVRRGGTYILNSVKRIFHSSDFFFLFLQSLCLKWNEIRERVFKLAAFSSLLQSKNHGLLYTATKSAPLELIISGCLVNLSQQRQADLLLTICRDMCLVCFTF